MIIGNACKILMSSSSRLTLALLSYVLLAMFVVILFAKGIPILQKMKEKFKGSYRRRFVKAVTLRFRHAVYKKRLMMNRLDERVAARTGHHLVPHHLLGSHLKDPEVEAFLSVLAKEGLADPSMLSQNAKELAQVYMYTVMAYIVMAYVVMASMLSQNAKELAQVESPSWKTCASTYL